MTSSANSNLTEQVGTDSVAIVSGGLDSVTLMYDMIEKGLRPHVLSFNYGQRHSKELTFAGWHAKKLGLPHDIIDLQNLTRLISNSALTSSFTDGVVKTVNDGGVTSIMNRIEVPEGHYAEDTMKATVVPNRNMIMLSIAAGVAVNESAKTIGIGVHAGDHFIYPDCRPEFIGAAANAVLLGNEGFHNFDVAPVQKKTPVGFRDEDRIHQTGSFKLPEIAEHFGTFYAPFLNKSKADIAYRALELEVPIHMTWSCYKGGDYHCGRCGTCVERLEAINEAGERMDYDRDAETGRHIVANNGHPYYVDDTIYEDQEFWKTAVANG